MNVRELREFISDLSSDCDEMPVYIEFGDNGPTMVEAKSASLCSTAACAGDFIVITILEG